MAYLMTKVMKINASIMMRIFWVVAYVYTTNSET